MKKLSILGSTGSIGQSALSLVDHYPDRFRVVTLAAHRSLELLEEQVIRYRPELVALQEEDAAVRLRDRLPGTRILAGLKGVVEAATHSSVDTVVSAISGAAGLIPTYCAILAGKDIALANKETLVMAGELIMSRVAAHEVRLLPVDSEHSALHQCLQGSRPSDVERLVLTASGGPFFGRSKGELERVSVEEALQHPTWRMGPKITIDSATLMNKGLEVIEAHHLFGVPPSQISIVVHPQSIIHSLVEFVDGTFLAQMSVTDMRLSLLYALSFPDRTPSLLPRLDLSILPSLEFYPPDGERFPSIRLAYQALESGMTFPAALNAANEVAVEFFLKGEIPFNRIPQIIEEVLNCHLATCVDELEAVLEADSKSREEARRVISAVCN